MVTAIIVLLGVAALVALSILRPSSPFLSPDLTDRDRQRQLDELRGLSGYRSDLRVR